MLKKHLKYGQDNLELINTAIELLNIIESMGNYEALIVGGTPRDILLGKNVHDVDIATNCPMDILTSRFKSYDIGKGKSFGVVVVPFKGFGFEIAQYRADGVYTDGRRPDDVVLVNNFFEDSARRDFTCNALGMNKEGTIIDNHGGIKDIKNGLIRTVGDPKERFVEDRLRMVRAARFMAVLGFNIEKDTRIAIKRYSNTMNKYVSVERFYNEFEKVAAYGGVVFGKFIYNLDKLRLLSKILPEVNTLKYMCHQFKHHPEGKTVYEHIIKCLEVTESKDITELLCILLHDVGKGTTLTEKDGYPRYKGHAQASADIVKDIGVRLKLSSQTTNALYFTALNHMKFHDLVKMKNSKIMKLVADPFWDTLVEVAKADEFSRGPEFKHNGKIERQLQKAEKVKNTWSDKATAKQINIVDGKFIMEVLGIKPGKLVGAVKEMVQNDIIDNSLDTDDDTIKKLIKSAYDLIIAEGNINESDRGNI